MTGWLAPTTPWWWPASAWGTCPPRWGSETDLQRRGLLNGGLLDSYKALVLLRLLLAGGADSDEVSAALARHR